MKKVLSLVLTISLLLAITACKKEDAVNTSSQQIQNQQTEEEITPEKQENTEDSEIYKKTIDFTITLENGAVMKGELYPDVAPKTVENFVDLCKKDFYDGLIFHRIIEGFMIQGGGYDKDLNPKEAQAIVGEFSSNGFENPLKHTRGVLSMARTDDPNSASSQFFIMHQDAPHLDGDYSAFGKITEGLEYIDEIATAKTTIDEKYGMKDFPKESIIIKSITID